MGLMILFRFLAHHVIRFGYGGVALACLLVLANGAWDRVRPEPPGVKAAEPSQVYQSEPVRPQVYRGDLRRLPRVKLWKPGDPVREVPRRVYPQKGPERQRVVPPPAQTLPDPLLGFQESSPQGVTTRIFSSPGVNVAGIPFTGALPPDTVGDVGLNHYIQMVNDGSGGSVFAIYDKSGTQIVSPTRLQSLWAAAGGTKACLNGLGDPIVLYDLLADRWLLSEFANPNQGSGNHLCVYISQTPDPVSGGWFLYDFPVSEFPDYPKYGVWPDAYYVSSNETSPAAYALDRAQMLRGNAATLQRFTAPSLDGFLFQALTPGDLDGPTPPPAGAPNVFMRHRDDETQGAVGESTLIDASGVWQTASVDITSALGSANTVVRFAFNTDDNILNAFEGFHVDDVSVKVDGSAVFTDTLESGAPGWISAGLWHSTTACSAELTGHSAPTTFYFGQDVTCDYNTGSPTVGTLDSPLIDLSGPGTNATLEFNYFLDTEQFCPFDDARVQISTDGGTTFSDVIGNCITPPADPTQDFLEIWEFQVDFANAANSSFTGPTLIPVVEFDSDVCGLFSFDCFTQPGTTTTLDPLREVIMHRLQYRNFGTHETLLGNFVVDVDGTDHGGIRWYELRRSGGGPWTLFQEGTYAPDQDHRWMGSIAMDRDGNVALGYSVSSTTTFPSIRYTGRLASDPSGTLQGESTLINGTFSQTGVNRWGDYSAMSVDPADDCTFWYTNEYVETNASNGFGTGTWGTRIGTFKFEACDNQIFADGFESGDTSAWTLTVP